MSKEVADGYKQEGNTAYRARDFDKAIEHYNKAWDEHKDIVYLNNLSAVYFEKGDYEKCIETCEEAINQGRELRADYKDMAKAYGRQGTAYVKKEDFENAIKFFNKSLTEHRTPDVLAKLKDAEKILSERTRLAYIDPAKSDLARDEGNKAFKASDFPTAVTHYTEAIKRNPDDARGYTNRATAYTKLLALPEALKDADKAIEVQPEFVKGYIKRSQVLTAMKEYTKALSAIELAAEKDTENKHTTEISSQMMKINQANAETQSSETAEQTYARAMRDPEIAQIMSDPAFQTILQQAQQDPKSLMQHMVNPDVRKKVEKLVQAGIIQTR